MNTQIDFSEKTITFIETLVENIGSGNELTKMALLVGHIETASKMGLIEEIDQSVFDTTSFLLKIFKDDENICESISHLMTYFRHLSATSGDDHPIALRVQPVVLKDSAFSDLLKAIHGDDAEGEEQ